MDTKRWFVRCGECLTVAAVDAMAEPKGAVCGLCEGKVETMGFVKRRRLVVGHDAVPACDERCTNAPGPKCSCACGAVNHGTGRVVVLDITTAVPRITPARDATTDKAVARAAEWRAAYAAAVEKIAPLGAREYAAKAAGEYLDGASFSRFLHYRDTLQYLRGARALRTHAARLARLASVLNMVANERAG